MSCLEIKRAWPLIYLANTIEHFRDRFAWRQAAHPSPLFQFAVSGGPRVLFECIALLVIFNEAIGKCYCLV